MRLSEAQWKGMLDSFIRDWTVRAVVCEARVSHVRVHTALTMIRTMLYEKPSERFHGPVEIDECFFGPQWHNRRPWQHGKTKRGRGTDKQPILGIYDRKTKQIAATLIPKVLWRYIHGFLRKQVVNGATLYTDTYTAYHPAQRHGYNHYTVDHHDHEYVRGDVGVNMVESFWGYVKRRYKVTGGLRRDRLHLYLAEWVWRWNHRHLSREAKVKRLLTMLKEQKFSGRKHN